MVAERGFLSALFAPRTHVSCCDGYGGGHDPVVHPERRILQDDAAAATSAGTGNVEPLADDEGREGLIIVAKDRELGNFSVSEEEWRRLSRSC